MKIILKAVLVLAVTLMAGCGVQTEEAITTTEEVTPEAAPAHDHDHAE